jgi:glycosyltransferase involved in cell wall biosynthesis
MVAIEAMACRRQSLQVQLEDCSLPWYRNNGLLAPPQDEAAFAQAIDRILSNPAWGDQLGQMGRQRVEIAMSWDSVASRLSCLYNQLLSKTTPASDQNAQVAA